MDEIKSADTIEDGEWLTIAAAARRLRISPRAIRGRIDRGTIEWRAAGNTGKLVLIRPADASADGPEDDPQDEIDRLKEELTESRLAQARLEERARLLRESLERERARVDALEEEMREMRRPHRPWWRRFIG